jgi:hypothetical protein
LSFGYLSEVFSTKTPRQTLVAAFVGAVDGVAKVRGRVQEVSRAARRFVVCCKWKQIFNVCYVMFNVINVFLFNVFLFNACLFKCLLLQMFACSNVCLFKYLLVQMLAFSNVCLFKCLLVQMFACSMFACSMFAFQSQLSARTTEQHVLIRLLK